MISVDRPGYGYSEFGKAEISIEKQAAMLSPLLNKLATSQKVILIGHSYGGPIAARLAADYPEIIGGLIMAAPLIDPENEKIFWFTNIAHTLRWMLPTSFRVASHEKVNHADQLGLLMPYWEKIVAPTTIIHGEKDGLAPFINVAFCRKVITNAPLKVVTRKDMNHFIPWENSNLVYEAIYRHLDIMEK
jgi:pimeloyl-ACP methyl ester carboxylesterase